MVDHNGEHIDLRAVAPKEVATRVAERAQDAAMEETIDSRPHDAGGLLGGVDFGPARRAVDKITREDPTAGKWAAVALVRGQM